MDLWNVREMSLKANLQEMERGRERYWLRYPATSPIKLRWRAIAARHYFHILPGESILELGGGSGLWTEQLVAVLRGRSPITVAIFNDDLSEATEEKNLRNVNVIRVHDVFRDLAPASFDYIVGTAILSHDKYARNLQLLLGLLKPGGQILFFEANRWNPQVLLKYLIPPLGRWTGQVHCQTALRGSRLIAAAAQEGFVDCEVVPFDLIHPRIPQFLIRAVQSISYILERTPLIRQLCGTLCFAARKAGGLGTRPSIHLAEHAELWGSTSVVVPCYNEEPNIRPLVEVLLDLYGRYLHEILIVNDNSTDRTAEKVLEIARTEPRVKLVNRKRPNGVGRALQDGYRVASGRYILSMDCDFVPIVPEFGDLFDAVARGKDGAIGSRFSHDSLLLQYPFLKIVGNRSFHLLANLFLAIHVRDFTNNLKLYRADIFKELTIEEGGFAANAETGLKPLMAGYDIEEVPVSWINRKEDMGASTFNIAAVAPGYIRVLTRAVVRRWSRHGHNQRRVKHK